MRLWQRIKEFFWPTDHGQPVKGSSVRIKNIAANNFRGLLGAIVPLCLLPWQAKYLEHKITVKLMWMWMFWSFLLQPVSIPCTGFIPIFLLPLSGTMSSQLITKCYMNEYIILFLLSSMILLLLNNSGVDRRFALWVLCSGDSCQFSGKRLVFKTSLAAFILSMFCNRLIATSVIIQYVTPILMNMQNTYGKDKANTDYDETRYIVNNAIQTSSAIGSLSVMHSAYASIAFRTIWSEAKPKGQEYPDIFNYMQWSLHAFPLALVMWTCNVVYHMLLINCYTRKPMAAIAMTEVRGALLKTKTNNIPKNMTVHEKITLFFMVFALVIFFCRWSELMGYHSNGWAEYRKGHKAPPPEGDDSGGGGGGGGEEGGRKFRVVSILMEAPVIKDAVVAAIFVVALHWLPRSLNFMNIWNVDKRSELKDLKPESSILWWRFVDQNTNYGYFFLLGSGVALNMAIRDSGLAEELGAGLGKELTGKGWHAALFLVCFVICVLANAMSGVAALIVFLPFVINAGQNTTAVPWEGKLYLPALGVGIGASLGFMSPFMYTPGYFCHHIGKVPKIKMMKYSLLSVIMCMLLLWFSLCYWAPFCWDMDDRGIRAIPSPITPPAVKPAPAP